MYRFSKRSERNLEGVHPDLVRLAREVLAVSPLDFGITEGLRTPERQKELIAQRKSQTVNSRHLTGHAIDFVVYVHGKVTWDFLYYRQVADVFKATAKKLGIAIVWGGDWKTLKDGPHIELDRRVYPAENTSAL